MTWLALCAGVCAQCGRGCLQLSSNDSSKLQHELTELKHTTQTQVRRAAGWARGWLLVGLRASYRTRCAQVQQLESEIASLRNRAETSDLALKGASAMLQVTTLMLRLISECDPRWRL